MNCRAISRGNRADIGQSLAAVNRSSRRCRRNADSQEDVLGSKVEDEQQPWRGWFNDIRRRENGSLCTADASSASVRRRQLTAAAAAAGATSARCWQAVAAASSPARLPRRPGRQSAAHVPWHPVDATTTTPNDTRRHAESSRQLSPCLFNCAWQWRSDSRTVRKNR